MGTLAIGQKFGRWEVVGLMYRPHGPKDWNRQTVVVRCACGNERRHDPRELRRGRSTSCGCLAVEMTISRSITHGDTRGGTSAEWRAWAGMRSRCGSPTDRNFANYGGRGISVCDRWRDSFENFLADMGRRPSPSHSIDRIDNDRGYEPGNCRWATKSEQSRNRRPFRWRKKIQQSRALR